MVNQSSAILYTMGIFDDNDDDRNPGVLRQLSRISGGESFFPETLQEILPICEQIAHDIRNQYTIAYAPANKPDGTYRAVEMRPAEIIHARAFDGGTRAGYSAPVSTSPMNPSSMSGALASHPQATQSNGEFLHRREPFLLRWSRNFPCRGHIDTGLLRLRCSRAKLYQAYETRQFQNSFRNSNRASPATAA